MLAVICLQRSDRYLGTITENFSYYQVFLGDVIKKIDGKTARLHKKFWWILQKVCSLFNTHVVEPPSKTPCEPCSCHCSMKSLPYTPRVPWNQLWAQGVLLGFLALFPWAKVRWGTGKKMGGEDHEEVPVVWFRGRLAGACTPQVLGAVEETCVAESDKELCSSRVLVGTYLLETGQGGSLAWPALTALASSDNPVYACPEDGLQLS